MLKVVIAGQVWQSVIPEVDQVFKDSLGSTASLRLAWASSWDLISKHEQQKKSAIAYQ
jgi:hypothetical protein